MKESEIQKQILDYMKLKGYIVFKHSNVGIFKQDTKRYISLAFGEKGISDIIACSPTGRAQLPASYNSQTQHTAGNIHYSNAGAHEGHYL